MVRSRLKLAISLTFGCAVLCAPGCAVNSASDAQIAAAGQASMNGGSGGNSLGGAASPTAGTANRAGATSAGAGGAVTGGGAAGVSGSAGTTGIASGAGGTGTAGGSAGTGGGGAPCRARPGLLACDDFEGATLGAVPTGPWSAVVIGDGTVKVDDTVPAHSGSRAVHIHGTGYQTLLVYHDAARLPQPSGRFYVRAFLRLAEAMTSGHNTFVLADTFAAPNAGNALRVGEQNSMLMMTVGGDAHGYLSNQNYYNDHLPGVVFKASVYTCLELLLDSPHTEIQVWADGVDVPDLHVTDLAHENYDALRFGFEKYAGPESDIWYDDIAIGTERIGCD